MDLLLVLLFAAAAQAFLRAPPPYHHQRAAVLLEATSYSKSRQAWAALEPRTSDEVLVVDGDNVRGKSGWAWTAAALALEVGRLPPRSVLFLDHGEVREAFAVDGTDASRFALAFAGPRSTADDGVVEAVDWFLGASVPVAIVTSDYGLRARVTAAAARRKRGSGCSRVRFVHAHRLVEALATQQPAPAPDFVSRFNDSYTTLATHVLSATVSPKFRTKARISRTLAQEKTWMRVVLAERLRHVANAGSLTGLLAEFAAAYSRCDDRLSGATSVLAHPLAEKNQRKALAAFANSLRDSPDDVIIQSPAEQAPRPIVRCLRPRSRRRRRRNLHHARSPSPSPAVPTLHELLHGHRDALNAALADFFAAD